MKIAYLMHYMKNNFEEITENLDILINQGDDVYLMVNDDDLRGDRFYPIVIHQIYMWLTTNKLPFQPICHYLEALLY